MSLCLPLAYYQQSQAGKAKRARTDAEQPLMNGGEVKPRCSLFSCVTHAFKRATLTSANTLSKFMAARPYKDFC